MNAKFKEQRATAEFKEQKVTAEFKELLGRVWFGMSNLSWASHWVGHPLILSWASHYAINGIWDCFMCNDSFDVKWSPWRLSGPHAGPFLISLTNLDTGGQDCFM